MRLFVHVAYGNATVHKAETPEDLRKIYNEFREMFRDFYDPEDFEELFGPEPDLITPITERTINMMLDSFGMGEHESLDWGTGFTNLKG